MANTFDKDIKVIITTPTIQQNLNVSVPAFPTTSNVTNDSVVPGLSSYANQNTINEFLYDRSIRAVFAYEHDQQVASAEWIITHNLGKMPSVTVIDSGDNIVIGDTEYISNNQLKISFTGAFTGKAYLV